MTPAREPGLEPTFQPLKPAKKKPSVYDATVCDAKSVDVQNKGQGLPDAGLFSYGTFGSKSSCASTIINDLASSTGRTGSLTPVFRRIQGAEDLDRSSLCPPEDHRKRHSSNACS